MTAGTLRVGGGHTMREVGCAAPEPRTTTHACTCPQVPGLPAVDAVRGEALLNALGLSTARAQLDVALLAVFYVAFIVLAILLFKLKM